MKCTYLVMLSFTREDLPVRMFDDLDKAQRFSKRLRLPPTDKLLEALDKGDFGCGIHDAIDVRIVRFADGVPDSTLVVKSFDEDEG